METKKLFSAALLLCSIACTDQAQSQSILSGGFEFTPVPGAGFCGITADQFQTSTLNGSSAAFAAFGSGSICYTDGAQGYGQYQGGNCPGQTPSPTEGGFCVGMSKDVTYAMQLSTSLSSGACYQVTFDVINTSSFGSCTTPARLEFGVSNSASSFGTSVVTMAADVPNADVWLPAQTVKFTAPAAGMNYLTFRIPASANSEAFLFVDKMSIATVTCTALPVRLLSFNATAWNKKVKLAWSAAAVQDNKGFRIQRSADGLAWNSIGFVNGGAVAEAPIKEYTYEDGAPLSGINYYRLEQEDVNGASVYSGVRTVRMGTTPQLLVSPNPVQDHLSIAYDGGMVQDATLTNAMGQTIAYSREAPYTMDMSKAPAGIYLLHIRKTDGGTQVEKVVKE